MRISEKVKPFIILVLVLFFVQGVCGADQILVLHFDEGSGTIAHDSSGNGNDGTINGATWVNGISGTALRYDGVNDYVSLPDLDAVSAEFTIISWVKSSSSAIQTIVGGGDGFVEKYHPSLGISYNTTHKAGGCVNRWGNYSTSVTDVDDGKWHQVVFSGSNVNANTADMKIYVDGRLSDEINEPFPVQPWAENLYIGKRANERYFNGVIDEVEIYSRVLTPAEVLSNFNSISASAGDSQALVLHFDEGSGTIAHDSSGNGYDGIIYGATWTDGISNGGLSFDGNDYVQFSSPIINQPPATVIAWVKPIEAIPNHYNYVIANGGETQLSYGLSMLYEINPKIGNGWEFYVRNSPIVHYAHLEGPADTATWTQLVGVWEASGNASLYKNGELVANDTTAPTGPLAGPNKMRIGSASVYNAAYFFRGRIDEVSIYSRALTPDEILASYSSKASSISITSPKGGETWQQGSVQAIQWTYTGDPGSDVRIELVKGDEVATAITESTSTGSSGSGSFSWTVPSAQAAGSDYRVQVTIVGNPSVSDMSNTFTIIESSSLPFHITQFDVDEGMKLPGDTVNAVIEITHDGTEAFPLQIEYSIRDSDGVYYTIFSETRNLLPYTSLLLAGDELEWSILPTVPNGPCVGRLIITDPNNPSDPPVISWDIDTFSVNVPEKSDLVFESIEFLNENTDEVTVATKGQQLSVHLDLKNQGGTNVDQTTVKVFLQKATGDEMIGEKVIPSLPASSSAGFALPMNILNFDSGKYTVYAIVDPDNLVAEDNESNNQLTTQLKVINPQNLRARVVNPDQNEHIMYKSGDENLRVFIDVELYDSQTNQRIDFLSQSTIIGKIHAMPLWIAMFDPGVPLEGRPDIWMNNIAYPKVPLYYEYLFDTYQFKEQYGKNYDIDPENMINPQDLSFVWGEYWIHCDYLEYLPNENNPGVKKTIPLSEDQSGYFTLGTGSYFQVDQLVYPLWYNLFENRIISCVTSLAGAKLGDVNTLITLGNLISSLLSGNVENVAATLLEVAKILPGASCIFSLMEYTHAFLGDAEIDTPAELWDVTVGILYSPATLHVYDQNGNHVGIASGGQIVDQIEGVAYSGSGVHPQVIVLVGNQEGKRIELKGSGEGKMSFELGIGLPDLNHQTFYYSDIPVNLTTTAEIILGSSNPYHLMTVDKNGDGIIDETISPSLTPPLPDVIPLPGYTNPPTDPDNDGIYEDLNGNGRLDFADVVLYFTQMSWIAANEPIAAFDLNGNGRIDFADIVALFNEI